MVTIGDFLEGGAVEVTLRDNLIIAEKSTLGADDGMGVALMLEVIERREELIHGPMELIFTADEEQCLMGAVKLPKKDGSVDSKISLFQSKYLINCDALNFSKIFIGSCGANIYRLEFQVNRTVTDSGKRVIEIDLHGLKGGHSGGCVHLNRMNAVKIIARVLKMVIQKGRTFELVDFVGGEQNNIIPRLARARIAVSLEESEIVVSLIQEIAQEIFAEAIGTDDNPPQFSVTIGAALPTDLSLNFEETKKILNVILVYQFGPLRWSPAFPEYVDTSDNLATIKFKGNVIELITFPRSAVQSKLDETDQRIRAICEMSGLEYTISSQYSGNPWTPNVSSRLAGLFENSFEKVTGERKKFGITQVTIEPPEFLALGYEIDMVALSPSVPKAHAIGEYFDIREAIIWRNVVFDVLSKLTS